MKIRRAWLVALVGLGCSDEAGDVNGRAGASAAPSMAGSLPYTPAEARDTCLFPPETLFGCSYSGRYRVERFLTRGGGGCAAGRREQDPRDYPEQVGEPCHFTYEDRGADWETCVTELDPSSAYALVTKTTSYEDYPAGSGPECHYEWRYTRGPLPAQ